jgi:predicted ArsR family transcriptional regulator
MPQRTSTKERILKLLLRQGPLDAFDIKRELGVTRSTVYRNLQQLQEAQQVKWLSGRTASGQTTKLWVLHTAREEGQHG